MYFNIESIGSLEVAWRSEDGGTRKDRLFVDIEALPGRAPRITLDANGALLACAEARDLADLILKAAERIEGCRHGTHTRPMEDDRPDK